MPSENTLKSPFRKIITGNLSIQVMTTIFAIILYTICMNYLSESAAAGITTAVSLPLYIVMIYTFGWGIGERERNMVIYGHMQEEPSRGIRAGFYSILPIFLFSLAVMIMDYSGSLTDGVLGVYKMTTAPFIAIAIKLYDSAPYLLPIICIVSPLLMWFGYRNGTRLFRVRDRIIYSNAKSAVKDRRRR